MTGISLPMQGALTSQSQGREPHSLFDLVQLGGVHPSVLPNLPDGTFDLDLLTSKIRGDDPHLPRCQIYYM
jgi:hypothetical protein